MIVLGDTDAKQTGGGIGIDHVWKVQGQRMLEMIV